MGDDDPISNPDSRRSLIRRLLIGAAVGLLGAVVAAAWLLGLFTAEPDEVSLVETVAVAGASADETATDSASESTDRAYQSTDRASESTVDDATDDRSASTGDADSEAGTALAGQWSVLQSEATFVGYRADGQTGEAVGRSPGVTGTLVSDGSQIVSVTVTADMTQLESDSSIRDGHLADEGIEHGTYPTSTFVLTEPIDLPADYTEGETLSFAAVGDLAVRDITNEVTVALEAVVLGGELIVVGSTDISLDDFGASVSSTSEATMEFSLVFAA